MTKKELLLFIRAMLGSSEFRGSSPTWYRQSADLLQGLNVQGSQFGPSFYVNMFWIPNALLATPKQRPPEYKCPVRQRLESAYEHRRKTIEATFDLGNDLDDTERQRQLAEAIDTLILPIMNPTQDVAGLKQAIGSDVLPIHCVDLVGLAALDLRDER